MFVNQKNIIIPVFIPFMSCPGNCIFCDQKTITGINSVPTTEEISKIVLTALKKNGYTDSNSEMFYQVAFYGGSFTLAPRKLQIEWIRAVRKFSSNSTVRVSTRPDAVDYDWFSTLIQEGLDTVEIGVQSCNENVLKLAKRNHDVSAVVKSVKVVKQLGLKLGLQIMTGLPGQTDEIMKATADKIIEFNPDFIRIYPALVFKNTEMAEIFLKKEYSPYNLDKTLKIVSALLIKFYNAGIKIIRIGLHGDREFFSKGILAGPIEQGIRQRALSYIFQCCIRNLIKDNSLDVNPSDNSRIIIVSPKGQGDIVTGYKGMDKIKSMFNKLNFFHETSDEKRDFIFEIKHFCSNKIINTFQINIMNDSNIFYL